MSHRSPSSPRIPRALEAYRRVGADRAELARIGSCPPLHTCPWRAGVDPVVHDVLDLHALAGDGAPGSVVTESTPHHLVEGLLLFRRTLREAQEHVRKRVDQVVTQAAHNEVAVRRMRE